MNVPILNALGKYRDSKAIPLHVPGHKRGNIFKSLGIELGDLMALDTTEIPGIDNLHAPQGSIKEAQELAAKAFGADHSFFLVNGTTSGIYSMILSVTEPGDSIIIPRNCHKSVTGAVILGRLKPVFITPEIDEIIGIACAVSPEQIEKSLKDNPEVKAVVITSPTYYGTCSDLAAIADIVHSFGKLLLVDEAHGAHFAFSERLPISAISAGADMAAQSTHKTLASMTGSSMLHVRSKAVDLGKLKFFLQLTQTTSPSHVMMASLDLARYIMEAEGERLLAKTISLCRWARSEINKLKGLYCIDESKIGSHGIYDIDATRLVVNFSGLNIPGPEAESILRDKYNIQVELSDANNVVAVSTIGDKSEYLESFVAALKDMSEEISKRKESSKESSGSATNGLSVIRKSIPKMAVLPHEALYIDDEAVKLNESKGRVCKEMIIPYPPGIPVIMPGEIIDDEVLCAINDCMENGINLNGMSDSSLKTIKVMKNGWIE